MSSSPSLLCVRPDSSIPKTFTAVLSQHPLRNSCSHCPYIDVTASMNKVTSASSSRSTSYSIWRDYIFLSLAPAPAHQLQIYFKIYICSEHVCKCSYHPGPRHQNLLPKISNSFPTDLLASDPFSTQQPDGTSSQQPPDDAPQGPTNQARPTLVSPVNPLLAPF